ncbi:hypothetical protein [Moraxella bovis]|uniref:Uncharacterized protein n=1 Tax=Moraxella bovis TaxID=476 RepID=A0A378PQI4_MORBO|nr:hypothetical protein [Moraxella bovis]UYZ68663.1 hypothetical protein LP122_00650 [Moraxella bovis]UYZ71036.1 hypothetical protein LP089_00660 [Moraxella bovis]UYZ73043.1 hypothetical protein LP105_11950 [Moraxella bovis]UYZ75907.1 hypothetical protein LP093_00775 [Moraxella bovis]UYZ78152.1 hypothetical protein LP115_13080 [Moraxella bovis]
MNIKHMDLVLSFNSTHKDEVLQFVHHHPFKDKFTLLEDNKGICLILNETKMQNFTCG